MTSSKQLLKLTRPSEGVWQLSFDSAPDNRLTDVMLSQLRERLDEVESQWRAECAWKDGKPTKPKGGALVITSEHPKFFSNGLDYENSIKNPNFHPDVFSPALIRLLTFPLLTVAAINGHAFAGGMLVSMACDYRIMTTGRAWCCMNEIDFGAPYPPLFAALLKYRSAHARPLYNTDPKHPKPVTNLFRSIALGHRFTGPEMLVNGLVDELVEPEKIRERAMQIGEEVGKKAVFGVWGSMKEGMYRDVLEAAKDRERPVMPWEANTAFEKRMAGEKGRDAKL